jgi:adenylate cyclase, class 2
LPREIEIKFRLDEAATLRARLEQLQATRMGRVHETNLLLDTGAAALRQAGCALRVRTERPDGTTGDAETTLTFKGRREPDDRADGLKTREELEVKISDATTLLALLDRLGFRAVLCYEKRRETWRFAKCLITLDELPGLGWFAEIEGPDEAAIHAAQAALALDAAVIVHENYAELTVGNGRIEEKGVRALRFGQA